MFGFSRKALAGALIIAPAVFSSSALAQGDSRAATYSKIFHFSANANLGTHPAGGLYRDGKGYFYGTTTAGGGSAGCDSPSGCGVIYRLGPPTAGSPGWKYIVLHKFTNAQGDASYGTLVANAAGTLFGATYTGGANDQGTIFQLVPPQTASGTWRFKVIHTFDGAQAGGGSIGDLLVGSNGALFGMTGVGGSGGKGTVFRLRPPAAGQNTWTMTVLHAFTGFNGDGPWGGLVADADGRLYGTTVNGGQFSRGVIFRLAPLANGNYAYRVLHHFGANGGAGAHPNGTLVLRNNFLYGTTSGGGTAHVDCDIGQSTPGCGIIFRLQLPATPAGTATFRNLHTMDPGPEGGAPQNGLSVDSSGNLYGVNYLTGPGLNNGQGTFFRLLPPLAGQNTWRFQTLHGFGGQAGGLDGDDPTGVPLRASNGVFYGTAQYGGTNDNGIVYSWKP